MSGPFDIALLVAPGLEPLLRDEVKALGFPAPRIEPGAVTFRGEWPDVWRANLSVRGANRVLVRVASFRVQHLAQLDKRSRALEWRSILPKGAKIRVDATCRKSKIYHSGAAAQRVATAALDAVGGELDRDQGLLLILRIENDMASLSLDTSGALLHKRGFKQAVAKAPVRETMASLFLRACGYDGLEPVLDPMCGSGTIPIEAAEWACGMIPGRARTFAFEAMPSFDAKAYGSLKQQLNARPQKTDLKCWGSDRDAGAVESACANAQRAGVEAQITFRQRSVVDVSRPEGPPGLIFVNPPYGARVGENAQLASLYRQMGRVFLERFSGWRVGLIAPDSAPVKACGLPFHTPSAPIPHGSLKIRLHQTVPLP